MCGAVASSSPRRRRPWPRSVAAASGVLAACLAVTAVADDATASVGLGRYHTALQGDDAPPAADYRSGEAAGVAAPTNQWYSSVMFQRWSQPLYAQPMTYRATEAGFELGLPDKKLLVEDGGRKRTIEYLHAPAVVVSPLGFTPRDARLAKFSDWLVQVDLADGNGASLDVTVLHGSPFSYYDCSKGDVRFSLQGTPQVLADPRQPGHDPRVAAFNVAGHAYAVFGPTGASWDWSTPSELILHLPSGARYFSVAGLPDGHAATLADFLAVAYAVPTDTRVEWQYDARTSVVQTRFHVETVAREGSNGKTFMGLYPHQWFHASPTPESKYQYATVRGAIHLVTGNDLTTRVVYHGILPAWGGLVDAADRKQVDSILVGDLAKSDQLFTKMPGNGTYWYGKGLGALAQLASVAEAEGELGKRDKLIGKIESRMESWFDGRHSHYFAQDAKLGTFVGFPQEYFSVSHMNDHHFHYGYWITAAAHVALRDPAWASAGQWGGMVDKIIADIATDQRGRRDFPFLRNFDPYAGHSWADGMANFDAGNNQESSSEAVNAWAGLILWGEATGNRRLRDLGIYLYTTEVTALQQYWFDLNHQVLAPEYGKPFAAMLFGGKYAYNTWWTEEPRQILGINLLPITPASTYLGADPAFVHETMNALPGEVKLYESKGPTDGTPADVWQDILSSYLALADPDAGLAYWNRRGSVEFGETRTHTLFWLLSLKEMGTPDLSVTADTPLYGVFRDKSGARTYLAYNAGDKPLHVTFSSGTALDVPPHSLARTR